MADRFKLMPIVHLVLKRNDEVLFTLRQNTGYQDEHWGLVAGHPEGDELASQAVVREASEEIGIVIDPASLRLVHTAHCLGRNDKQERVDLFFEAVAFSGEPINIEPEKCGGLQWATLQTLPQPTIPFIRNVLLAIEQAEPYSEYLSEPL